MGVLYYEHPDTGAWTPLSLNVDHGLLGGLGDDDHPQYLLKSGGTMTGPLTLAADPVSALQAATRKYTDQVTGNVGMSVAPVSMSFNDITTPGVWPYLMHGTTNPNGPKCGHYVYVHTYTFGDMGNRTQVCYPYRDGSSIYIRDCYEGSWSAWTEVGGPYISGTHQVHTGYGEITAVEPAWTPMWPGIRFEMPATQGWVKVTCAGYAYVRGGTSGPQGTLFGVDLGVWGETVGDGQSGWSNGNAVSVGRLTAPANTELRMSVLASGWRYYNGGSQSWFAVPMGSLIGSAVPGAFSQFGQIRITLELYPGGLKTIPASTFVP